MKRVINDYFTNNLDMVGRFGEGLTYTCNNRNIGSAIASFFLKMLVTWLYPEFSTSESPEQMKFREKSEPIICKYGSQSHSRTARQLSFSEGDISNTSLHVSLMIDFSYKDLTRTYLFLETDSLCFFIICAKFLF